jgi:hypothetical protein
MLIVCVAVAAGSFYVYHTSMQIEKRRKRDGDAVQIRNAIFAYMPQHEGELPTSLHELTFDGRAVDPSPFHLLPPGSRPGKLQLDVLVEAKQGGNGRLTIYIYKDGTVSTE